MNCKIPWYMDDPRFEPGTVADVGNVRIHLRKTDRKSNNKWRIYMAVRTRKGHGVPDSLKREVVVAQFSSEFTLAQAQHLSEAYLADFLEPILADCNPNMKEITRCEDCKNCDFFYPEKKLNEEPRGVHYCNLHKVDRNPDGYCDFGRRKDGKNG